MMCARLVVLVLCSVGIPGLYSSCEYYDKLEPGVFHVSGVDLDLVGTWNNTTLYECMARCFVNMENCNSFNYWSNTSQCQYLKGIDSPSTKRAGEHVLHGEMTTLPSEMKDIVGGCSSITCTCFLDRFNRPRCLQIAPGTDAAEEELEDDTVATK